MADNEETMKVLLEAQNDTEGAFDEAQDNAEELKSRLEELNEEIVELDVEDEDLVSAEDEIDETTSKIDELEESAETMGSTLSSSAEEAAEGMEQLSSATEEAAEGMGKFEEETEQATEKTGEFTKEAEEATESSSSLADAITAVGAVAGLDMLITTADNIKTSWERLDIVFKGTGTSIDDLKQKQSELTESTGRSGGTIREYFNAMGVAGVTNANLLSDSFEAVSGRAFVTGKSVESLEATLQRLTLSGTVNSRSLLSLGLSLDDLGEAMGTTGEEASKMFKTLSQEDRLRVLVSAMGDTTEANEDYKNSLAGLEEQGSAAFAGLAGAVGSSILPVVIPIMKGATELVKDLTAAFKMLPEPVQMSIGVLGALAFAIIGVQSAISLLGNFQVFTTLFSILTGGTSVIEGLTVAYDALAISEYIALGPLLLIVGAVIAIGVAIYELGKYLGWWNDFGGMVDAVWAGIQRLWSAFINHPDVQGLIRGIKDAWKMLQPHISNVIKWVQSFFKNNNKGKFDIVRAAIDAIGFAWKVLTFPIRTVIQVVQWWVKGVLNAHNTVISSINHLKSIWTNSVNNIRNKLNEMKNNIVNPVRNAIGGVESGVNSIKNYVLSLLNIDLSSLTNKITAPFTNAYNSICGIVDDIKAKAKQIPVIGGAFAGEELDFGYNPTNYTVAKSEIRVKNTVELLISIKDVPTGLNKSTIYDIVKESLQDKDVIDTLVSDDYFQDQDEKIKESNNRRIVRYGF